MVQSYTWQAVVADLGRNWHINRLRSTAAGVTFCRRKHDKSMHWIQKKVSIFTSTSHNEKQHFIQQTKTISYIEPFSMDPAVFAAENRETEPAHEYY